MEHLLHIIYDLVVIFGVGTAVVFVFHHLRQSPLIGFLATGIIVGPYGLGLIGEEETVHALAEIGVMLLLFSLGLEFSLNKLFKMRAIVFGTGTAQVVLTAGAVAGTAVLFGLPANQGVFLGFVAALSSTAIILKLLLERGEMGSIHGRVCLGILIFQDLCVVPMMVLVPLLAAPQFAWMPVIWALGKAALVIVATILVARIIFPPLLDRLVGTRSQELFVVGSLWILFSTAWLLSNAGFSLALGGFLAGLVLSESEFAHKIFSDVRPIRDGLNSLFFISIGMLVDLQFLAANLPKVAGVIAAIVVGKGLLAMVAILITRLPPQVALLSGLSLAQIGEFSFILLEASSKVSLLPDAWYQTLITSAVTTMILTPGLFWIAHRTAASRRFIRLADRLQRARKFAPLDEACRQLDNHVIIAGFGIGGRALARLLKKNEIPHLVLETNLRTVRSERQKGETIFYGDVTDPEVLRHADIERARAVVVTFADPYSHQRAVAQAKHLNPQAKTLVRTKFSAEIEELYQLGAHEVASEEFEVNLQLLRSVLQLYGFSNQDIRGQLKEIRDSHYDLIRHP
ncbi:MAG TPA: cation:proton antiporter [Acidobacteriota bacterium]|nr:cation:proton antiporter [Acidobacteriota bacterium]